MKLGADERGQATPGGILIGATVFVIIFVIFAGLFMVIPAFFRYQSRQNALNAVRVTAIQIRNQEQRVEIAKQRAEIRRQDAIGIREAQEEISKTLTPLYVQFETIDAMRRIAESGRNNSIIFIPTGAMGVPLVNNLDVSDLIHGGNAVSK